MGNDVTTEILEEAFDITGDPWIGQQLCRFYYIRCRNWDRAKEIAAECINLERDNSFLLDTMGQVLKSQAQALLLQASLDDEQASRSVSLALESISYFQKAQERNRRNHREMKEKFNNGCYVTEIKLATALLDGFSKFESFPGYEDFHKFLLEPYFTPPGLKFLQGETRRKLKKDTMYEALMKTWRFLHEKITHIKQRKDISQDITEDTVDQLPKLRSKIEIHYGEPYDQNAASLSEGEQANYRRRQMYRICHIDLFSLTKPELSTTERKSVFELSKQNLKGEYHYLDILAFLGSSLAIAAFEEENERSCLPEYPEFLYWSTKLYDQAKDEPSPYLEVFLCLALFHWPTESRQKYRLCSPDKLNQALDIWKAAFRNRYNRDNEDRQRTVRDRTHFFLGNGDGLNEIVYYKNLQGEELYRGEEMWEHEDVIEKLQRQKGILIDETTVRMEVTSYSGNKSKISFPTSKLIRQTYLHKREVTFVLGVGWAGPTAFDIKKYEKLDSKSSATWEERTKEFDKLGNGREKTIAGDKKANAGPAGATGAPKYASIEQSSEENQEQASWNGKENATAEEKRANDGLEEGAANTQMDIPIKHGRWKTWAVGTEKQAKRNGKDKETTEDKAADDDQVGEGTGTKKDAPVGLTQQKTSKKKKKKKKR